MEELGELAFQSPKIGSVVSNILGIYNNGEVIAYSFQSPKIGSVVSNRTHSDYFLRELSSVSIP